VRVLVRVAALALPAAAAVLAVARGVAASSVAARRLVARHVAAARPGEPAAVPSQTRSRLAAARLPAEGVAAAWEPRHGARARARHVAAARHVAEVGHEVAEVPRLAVVVEARRRARSPRLRRWMRRS
jgi:hypothetical protein